MADINAILKHPQFQALPEDQKRIVLTHAGMPQVDQEIALHPARAPLPYGLRPRAEQKKLGLTPSEAEYMDVSPAPQQPVSIPLTNRATGKTIKAPGLDQPMTSGEQLATLPLKAYKNVMERTGHGLEQVRTARDQNDIPAGLDEALKGTMTMALPLAFPAMAANPLLTLRGLLAGGATEEAVRKGLELTPATEGWRNLTGTLSGLGVGGWAANPRAQSPIYLKPQAPAAPLTDAEIAAKLMQGLLSHGWSKVASLPGRFGVRSPLTPLPEPPMTMEDWAQRVRGATTRGGGGATPVVTPMPPPSGRGALPSKAPGLTPPPGGLLPGTTFAEEAAPTPPPNFEIGKGTTTGPIPKGGAKPAGPTPAPGGTLPGAQFPTEPTASYPSGFQLGEGSTSGPIPATVRKAPPTQAELESRALEIHYDLVDKGAKDNEGTWGKAWDQAKQELSNRPAPAPGGLLPGTNLPSSITPPPPGIDIAGGTTTGPIPASAAAPAGPVPAPGGVLPGTALPPSEAALPPTFGVGAGTTTGPIPTGAVSPGVVPPAGGALPGAQFPGMPTPPGYDIGAGTTSGPIPAGAPAQPGYIPPVGGALPGQKFTSPISPASQAILDKLIQSGEVPPTLTPPPQAAQAMTPPPAEAPAPPTPAPAAAPPAPAAQPTPATAPPAAAAPEASAPAPKGNALDVAANEIYGSDYKALHPQARTNLNTFIAREGRVPTIEDVNSGLFNYKWAKMAGEAPGLEDLTPPATEPAKPPELPKAAAAAAGESTVPTNYVVAKDTGTVLRDLGKWEDMTTPEGQPDVTGQKLYLNKRFHALGQDILGTKPSGTEIAQRIYGKKWMGEGSVTPQEMDAITRFMAKEGRLPEAGEIEGGVKPAAPAKAAAAPPKPAPKPAPVKTAPAAPKLKSPPVVEPAPPKPPAAAPPPPAKPPVSAKNPPASTQTTIDPAHKVAQWLIKERDFEPGMWEKLSDLEKNAYIHLSTGLSTRNLPTGTYRAIGQQLNQLLK